MCYKRLLLIDDDETDQRIFSIVLQSIAPDLTCTVKEDAAHALYQLETEELSADLIFLDVRMPGMTGVEFLQELRKQENLKQTPVVVLSGVPNPDDMRQTKELGAIDYIIKPGKYSELKQILVSILQPSS